MKIPALFFFYMNCEKEILKVLYESGGQGLSVKKICVHVYNAQNSLFDTLSYDDIRKSVVSFLQRNSGKTTSLLLRTSVRGHYRINLNSNTARQLVLQFDDCEPEVDTPGPGKKPEPSLSLFD